MTTITVNTTQQINVSPVVQTSHGHAQLVRCPWCRAAAGSPCRKRSGDRALHAHRARWDAFYRTSSSSDYIAKALVDDPSSWSKGDLLWCRLYRLDPQKSTVLRNLTTGDDPGRNSYNRGIELLRFLA